MNLSVTVKEAVAATEIDISEEEETGARAFGGLSLSPVIGPQRRREHGLRVHPGAESARNPAGTA